MNEEARVKAPHYLDSSAEGLAEARRRIAEAGRTGAYELDLRGLDLTEIPDELLELKQITSLDLSFNGIGADGARALSRLVNLTRLDLGGNQIGADGARALSRLVNLTQLDLWGNNIGADGARALSQLTALTRLDLGDNQIGADGARALSSLVNLTQLDLRGNQIGADGARALSQLTALTSLDLSFNDIGADGARALSRLVNLTRLDLRGNDIGADGARALSQLVNLAQLDLGGNNIGADGARALSPLVNLTQFDLWGNNIGAGGARALSPLVNLTQLNLRGNNIGADGARTLSRLVNLTQLDLGDNQIGADGARALNRLVNLTRLDLGGNQIGDDGARALSQLTALTSLDLSFNGIGADGARALSRLVNLTRLDLGGNQIGADGARALSRLVNLTQLDLWGNQIDDDGALALTQLTGLTTLCLRVPNALARYSIKTGGILFPPNQVGNLGVEAFLDAWIDRPEAVRFQRLYFESESVEGLKLPKETIESGDAQAIFAAWRTFRRAEQQKRLKPLNEAKMLVVGHEAVGKTSLINYLVYNRPRDPDEKKTRIEIHDWQPDGADGIKLNVWDFGGQEMMHGTHRYFLTARSLYLVVLQDRTEDDKSVYEWLRTIKSRGGDAPVIVVINKSDNGKEALKLNEPGLLRDYPNIAGFLRTSCNDDTWSAKSVAALRQKIVGVLTEHDELAAVRQGVPASWLWVKEQIAEKADQDHVLCFSDFVLLCAKARQAEGASPEDLVSEHEQRGLLRLLHDLGTLVVHGLAADDFSIRRDIALLDPNWLTHAIYTVLNEPRLLQQKGIFQRKQLKDWLDAKEYPPERHEFILDMMCDREIGLCSELPGERGRGFLVPEALSKSEPDYDRIWPEQSLRFRYRYEQLPSGLIPRFLVEAHKRLTGKPTLWHTGAVFEAADCRILVRGDVNKNLIDIKVCGTKGLQRSALQIILDDMERVHQTYRELQVKRRVPLPDKPEVDESYEHLLKLEAKHGSAHSYDPTDADREYTVSELLDNIPRELLQRDSEKMTTIHVKGNTGPVHINTGAGAAIHNPQTQPQAQAASITARAVSWPLLSVACGGSAALFALIWYFLPGWLRIWVGGLTGIALVVTLFVITLNPAWRYRRWLMFMLPAGVAANTLGGVFDLHASTALGAVSWHWDGSTSATFNLAWAVVSCALIFGDLKQFGVVHHRD